MSNFKNFSQQGLGSDVQFGKGGGRIVFDGGVFKLIAAPTGDDLARLKAADPTEDTDVVTLSAMTTAVNHVYAKLDHVAADMSSSITNLTTTMAAAKADTLTSADGKTVLHAADDGVHLTSPVVVGDGSSDGLIQPEGGHSLTLAGGDADVAGNVVIRGGHGTTPGHVELHDLVDPVAPQDAMTLAATQAAILKASAAIVAGSVRTAVGSFDETAGDTVVTTVPAGALLYLKVLITSPFSIGSTITIKTATSTLALPAIIDETQNGIYATELLQSTAATAITVSIETQGSGGAGALAIEYTAS